MLMSAAKKERRVQALRDEMRRSIDQYVSLMLTYQNERSEDDGNCLVYLDLISTAAESVSETYKQLLIDGDTDFADDMIEILAEHRREAKKTYGVTSFDFD